MIWPSQLNCVKGINSLVSTFLWLYYQVIRELREEVEKLRMMLKDQGGSLGGTASNPSSTQDVEMLKEKLSISENLMQEMSKTWEQKLAESEKLHQVSDSHFIGSCYVILSWLTGTSEGTGGHGDISKVSWYRSAAG